MTVLVLVLVLFHSLLKLSCPCRCAASGPERLTKPAWNFGKNNDYLCKTQCSFHPSLSVGRSRVFLDDIFADRTRQMQDSWKQDTGNYGYCTAPEQRVLNTDWVEEIESENPKPLTVSDIRSLSFMDNTGDLPRPWQWKMCPACVKSSPLDDTAVIRARIMYVIMQNLWKPHAVANYRLSLWTLGSRQRPVQRDEARVEWVSHTLRSSRAARCTRVTLIMLRTFGPPQVRARVYWSY